MVLSWSGGGNDEHLDQTRASFRWIPYGNVHRHWDERPSVLPNERALLDFLNDPGVEHGAPDFLLHEGRRDFHRPTDRGRNNERNNVAHRHN
jgi:hypothetical protein